MQPDAAEIFAQVYTELKHTPSPVIHLEYYPYSDVKHTVRRRQDQLWVRISDVFYHAPREPLHSLAFILLGKLLRRSIPAQHHQLYRQYLHSPEMILETAHLRAVRSRPTIDSGPGRCYDLNEILAALSHRYFGGNSLLVPRILWSRGRSRKRLGYYRESVHTIVISRALDHPRIPRYVVEYVVYHEMLHARIPVQIRGSRRMVHTSEFKRQEAFFEHQEKAEAFLRNIFPRKRKSFFSYFD